MQVNEFSQTEQMHVTGIQIKQQNFTRTLGSGPHPITDGQPKGSTNPPSGLLLLIYTSYGILQAARVSGC